MDLFALPEPEHIDQAGWAAVELERDRLRRAWDSKDYPEAVGKAKELVETVAKVVVVSAEGAVAGEADFVPTVKAAHKALRRQPGVGLSQDQDLRAIASATQTLATSLSPLRNTFGTGHGRARIPEVSVEMATVTVEAALVWCRWALRRLEHLLADYPNDLIDAVHTGTPRATLRTKFRAAAIAQQSEKVQHHIGVAFGQQSAGGFANATEVGVNPAIEGGFDDYPIAYRLGVLEGMLLTTGGQIGLPEFYASRFISLAASLPDDEGAAALRHLTGLARQASWAESWRGNSPTDPREVVAALRAEAVRLTGGAAAAAIDLCEVLTRPSGASKDSNKRDS